VQIVVNTRLLLPNRLEGMGWFAYQTLMRITKAQPKVHFVFLFDRPFHESFIFSDNVTPVVLSPQARHPFLYYWWFQHSVKPTLNRLKPDLFLSPDGFLSLGANCKQLPVIHDINFYHHPKDVKWLTSKYYNYFFPRFAKEASRIATVSEYSKADISTNYGVSTDKIDVVYNGVNPFFRILNKEEKELARNKFSLGNPYFIYVGSIHPRKNIPTLLKAFALFKKEASRPQKLVLAGPHYWGMADVYKQLKELSIEDEVIFTNRLSNEDLALALGGADALTFIPYYEGFGIPLVEAMEAGVPIIASNVTSLPEVGGRAALYADPKDAESVKNEMVKLVSDDSLASRLVEEGFIQKQKFSWDKSADLLWQSMLKAMDK